MNVKLEDVNKMSLSEMEEAQKQIRQSMAENSKRINELNEKLARQARGQFD